MIDFFMGKYRFLSNFYRASTMMDDVEYPTVEHAFQAAKTKNLKLRMFIGKSDTAKEAKELGSCVRLRYDWEEKKIQIMKKLVKQKFQNSEMKKRLLETGEQELIEGNAWNDIFWGVCRGEGRNELGKILMEVRQELRDEQ